MIPVGRLAPSGQWDTNMLAQLFANRIASTGVEFKTVDGYPNTDGCVLQIPGAFWADHYDTINEAIDRYKWILLFVTSDEEARFDINQLDHPNILFWQQTPRADRDYNATLFGCGWTPHFNQLPDNPPRKDLDVVLSAQNTHLRRNEAFAALEHVQHTKLINPTDGFTKGWTPASYADVMMRAKVCPCPAGTFSPDSFRLYEALEAGAVPIADDVSPREGYDSRGYWRSIFPDAPFPIFEDYADLSDIIDDVLSDWTHIANDVAAWWINEKTLYANWVVDDLKNLGAL